MWSTVIKKIKKISVLTRLNEAYEMAKKREDYNSMKDIALQIDFIERGKTK